MITICIVAQVIIWKRRRRLCFFFWYNEKRSFSLYWINFYLHQLNMCIEGFVNWYIQSNYYYFRLSLWWIWRFFYYCYYYYFVFLVQVCTHHCFSFFFQHCHSFRRETELVYFLYNCRNGAWNFPRTIDSQFFSNNHRTIIDSNKKINRYNSKK